MTPWLAALVSVASAAPTAAAATDPRPSVAVFAVDIKAGITPEQAAIVVDYITDSVRKSGSFSRVISSRDVEAVLSLERQKQLMDCSQQSCIAEMVGALGADMVLAGSVGKVGGYYLVNLLLVSSRTSTAQASFSYRTCAENEDNLVRVLAPASGYPFHRYLIALMLGRLPRFYAVAWLGHTFPVPTWALVLLFVVLIGSLYLGGRTTGNAGLDDTDLAEDGEEILVPDLHDPEHPGISNTRLPRMGPTVD